MNENKMEQPNTTHIEELLPRYCEGMATHEECLLVEAWIKESAENEKHVKQVYALYLATDTMNVLNKVNTEEALQSVKSRMNHRKTINRWNWLQRVAAILFIPLLIVLLIQNLDNEVKEMAQMIEVKTNPGMTTSIVLPDSTVVFLNSESSLQYPSHFDGDTRTVKLKGEAYFEVTKDTKKRFIVAMPHQSQIEVLGTSFNVEAYEQNIITTLVEGKVDFKISREHQVRKVEMKPGQKLIYDAEKNNVRLYATSCQMETSWKDGKIIFVNTSLEDALYMLEKRYGVTFIIKNNRLKDNYFTGTFTNQRLDRILEYFKISSNIHWRFIESSDINAEKTKIEIY